MITLKQITFKNVLAFIQGYYRYYAYLYFKNKLVRKHIIEQFEVRMRSADLDCIVNRECKVCGCKTPALFWANKACDKPCYPPMMNKDKWYRFIADKDWCLVNTKHGLKFEYRHKINE